MRAHAQVKETVLPAVLLGCRNAQGHRDGAIGDDLAMRVGAMEKQV